MRMTFNKSAMCDHSVFPDTVNDVGVGIGIGLCVTRPLTGIFTHILCVHSVNIPYIISVEPVRKHYNDSNLCDCLCTCVAEDTHNIAYPCHVRKSNLPLFCT